MGSCKQENQLLNIIAKLFSDWLETHAVSK
jgi:hypothetical protein